jgi:ABC-type antimicrobial peptide transport system permease subunit
MKKRFFIGFLVGFFLFVAINLLAAHLLSDCGLPSVLGMDYCADDITRAGWPFKFYEVGGFAYHRYFNSPILLLDIFIGFGLASVSGIVTRRLVSRKKNSLEK